MGKCHAWVTSAVEEDAVEKAVLLATSLRRVQTSKGMVVITTLDVSKEQRKRLEEAFDQVVLAEVEAPNEWRMEDYVKVHGFALRVFSKCVYVAAHCVVWRNCDDIFHNYDKFAAFRGGPKDVDLDVFLFTPSLGMGQALTKLEMGGLEKDFTTAFMQWVSSEISNVECLDERYNCKITMGNNQMNRTELDMSILGFVDVHPLDMDGNEIATNLDPIEQVILKHCLTLHLDSKNSKPQANLANCSNEPIAIVGMSFRLPGGNNVNEFWKLLHDGREAIQSVPRFRWTPGHTTVPCKNRNYQAGFLNFPIDEFDAKFFGISPKEAVYLDPQQRLLHEVAWEAFENAMIDPHTLRGTQTGVFIGSWIHEYRDIAVRCSDVDYFRVYMGNSIASGAARLSHFLGLTGLSIATESGCSFAIVALHMACKSLRAHETSLALSGGVNLLIHPQDQSALSFVVAPDGRSKTFDANANGFGRAEGCAVFVLKRYSDAVRDGDDIWGLIRGSAVAQEGISKSIPISDVIFGKCGVV